MDSATVCQLIKHRTEAKVHQLDKIVQAAVPIEGRHVLDAD